MGKEWSDFGGHFFLLPRIELISSTVGSGTGVGEANTQGRHRGDALLREGFTLAVNMRVQPGGGDWAMDIREAIAAVERMQVPWAADSPMSPP
jgi:hypothetical protein